jgi:hypothetical protein
LTTKSIDCQQNKPIKKPPLREAFLALNGALGAIRTPDPQIRSLMLYPAELRVLAVEGGGQIVEATGKGKRDYILFCPASAIFFVAPALRPEV